MRWTLVNSADRSARLARRFALCALLLGLVVVPAAAQEGSTNRNTATAMLHLRATYIPMTLASISQAPVQPSGGASFYVPVRPTFIETSEAVRDLPAAQASGKPAVLKTTIVLPH